MSEGKVKVIEDDYLDKMVSFKTEGDIAISGKVIAVTLEGELRIKETQEGVIYVGLPEDVDLMETPPPTERSIPKKEAPRVEAEVETEPAPVDAPPIEAPAEIPIAETLPPVEVETETAVETVIVTPDPPQAETPVVETTIEAPAPETRTEEPKAEVPVEAVATEPEPPVKKVKDHVFADILIREEGGTIDSLTADLQAEAGGSLVESKARVKNFMRFLVFLGVAELDDDLYVLNLAK